MTSGLKKAVRHPHDRYHTKKQVSETHGTQSYRNEVLPQFACEIEPSKNPDRANGAKHKEYGRQKENELPVESDASGSRVVDEDEVSYEGRTAVQLEIPNVRHERRRKSRPAGLGAH